MDQEQSLLEQVKEEEVRLKTEKEKAVRDVEQLILQTHDEVKGILARAEAEADRTAREVQETIRSHATKESADIRKKGDESMQRLKALGNSRKEGAVSKVVDVVGRPRSHEV